MSTPSSNDKKAADGIAGALTRAFITSPLTPLFLIAAFAFGLVALISLPREESINPYVTRELAFHFHYFFMRKFWLAYMAKAVIVFPGGFGTLDEMFELLTLRQTGKADPTPIVLLDAPGGSFWAGLQRFVDEHLRTSGVISEGDFQRVLITDSVQAAVQALTGFYLNYHSLRWVGKRLVLRLKAEPTDAEVDALNAAFADLLAEGRIERRGPLEAEIEDDDELQRPRLVLRLNQFRVGDLHLLIRAVNSLESAPKA